MVLMPDYRELTRLSNSELAQTMRLAKVQLAESKQTGEDINRKEHIYLRFFNEWERRLKVGNPFYR